DGSAGARDRSHPGGRARLRREAVSAIARAGGGTARPRLDGMDLRRFADLYAAETHENIRLLQRSLTELERDAPATAVAEAFRAAHTLKGITAAMGYQSVADLAHSLEDRLDGVRAGRVEADGGIVAALLAAADELEDAIAAAIRT